MTPPSDPLLGLPEVRVVRSKQEQDRQERPPVRAVLKVMTTRVAIPDANLEKTVRSMSERTVLNLRRAKQLESSLDKRLNFEMCALFNKISTC